MTHKVKIAIESVLNDEDQSVTGRVERIAEIVDMAMADALMETSFGRILNAVGLVIASKDWVE